MLEACPECDLLQHVPREAAGMRVYCARCGGAIALGVQSNPARDAALAITTLVLLGIANGFPILGLDLDGRHVRATVFDGVLTMWDQQRYELALVILAVAIVIPVLHAVSVLMRSYLISHPHRRDAARGWALWSARLAPWGMTEVYLLGALVAFVKLDDLATVVVGPALYAFALMSVLTAWSATHAAGVWASLRGQ